MFVRRITGCVLIVAAAVSTACADEITDWNGIMLNSIRADSTNPPKASRIIAMVNVAMFEAVNSINGNYEPYSASSTPPFGVLAQLAAAGAAHRILVTVYPAQAETLDTELANAQTEVSDVLNIFKQSSVDFGASVADQILALRSGDNSDLVVSYTPGSGPGQWQPTPPANAAALLPNWPYVTPWAMVTGSQLRRSAPPLLTSARYTADFNEVKSLGAKNGSTRTDDQTQIAQFWADGGGTETPPGHWINIAITIANAQGTTLDENSRLFALLGIALADSAISCWDNKYAYDHWRPITAIRNASTDGNAATDEDPAWESLITTPPFPGYTSGHSTFSGAASKVLELFFGTNAISFDATSDGLPGVTRSYSSLSQAAEEAGKSRVYGGIHFNYDSFEGLSAGKELGALVYSFYLAPVPTDTSSGSGGLCGSGGGTGLLAMTLLLVGPGRRSLRRRMR